MRNPQNTVQLLEVLAKFEERYSCKAIRGSRNSDNAEGRGWDERRMSNIGNNRGNWRNSEVVRRPNNGRNDYGGNYENSRQGNQWFESRNRFQNNYRRFNDRGYQFRNRSQNYDFSRGDQSNRGSSEKFSRGVRRQMGRLNVLKVSDVKGGSKIILDFDRKSLAIQDSQVEDIKVDEGNLRVDVSETKLDVVANVSDKNSVESIIGEKVNCAIIRDLALSSRDQLIEERRTDPELGHIYRYLENPEDSSVNAAISTQPLSSATRKVVAKFKPKFEGPYRVRDVKNNNVEKENPESRNSNAHHKRLQPQTTKRKRVESRPTIERKTQQGEPFRSRKGRGRNDSPYIEELPRPNNRNARRGGDQQRQDQERILYEEVYILGGLGRKRQLQVIRTRLNFTKLNRTVTCMVLKAKANDRRTSSQDEFRWPRPDYVRQVALEATII
ncbi:uncharacterized protein TNCV_4318641 [Trichonephila clavipes]|nr:uncharacterized protein TNCV_4318641 [Trichonephila clavipes]